MRFRFYAIARRLPGRLPEFYASIAHGEAVGWTWDIAYSWNTDSEKVAEVMLNELHHQGHFDAYIYVYSEEVRLLP